MTITERLADYALSFDQETICSETRAIANKNIRDVIGCMLAGSQERSVKMAEDLYHRICGSGEFQVIGAPGYKTDLLHAAMLNAMEAHVRDFDDIVVSLEGHATISMFPVALVVGEYVGASGEEVLEAYISGVETAGLLGSSLFAKDYKAGWDSSGTIGVFGATVVAARLLKLNREQLINALGIAVNEASGTRSVYGYMNKDISAGHTAMKGVFCALAAQSGFDSCPDSFENRSGYLATFADGIDEEIFDRIVNERISTFIEPGIIGKLYPSCRDTHCAVDAAMQLAEDYDINIADIKNGFCYAPTAALYNDRFPYPETPSQAKFSMPYGVALALANHNLELDDFDGETLRNSVVSELCSRFEVVEDDEHFPNGGAEVVVCTKDGTRYSQRVEVAKGAPSEPLGEDVMKEKFYSCYSYITHKDNAKNLFEELNDFGKINNVKGLTEHINSLI